MATQRRFEASTLAAVLAKVQKEVGPNASISTAQRVRSGGVGGFFAREKFEVIVEIPDPGEEMQPKAESTRGTAQPKAESTHETQPKAKSTRGTRAQASPITESDENYDPITSLLGLAEKISKEDINEVHVPAAKTEQAKMETTSATREPEVLKADEPRISTESDSFAEVLSRVAFQAHVDEEQEAQRPQETIPDRPAFLDAQAAQPQPAQPQPAQVQPQPAQPQPQPQPQPALNQTPVIQQRTNELAVPQQRTRISDHPLAQLGLPTEYIPVGATAETMQEQLTSALERLLPRTPDIRASKGSVICVVGERFDAMEVAEELAEQFGRPTEEIVLASQTYRGKGAANVLRSVRNAEDAQRSWSRRPRPTIVAIEANPGSRDASWAEQVLTALEPIATYGVADATRKSDDIKAWADALGGVDCLAINHIEETVSPAAVLATGIPVDRVDGRRASAAFWALLLTERLLAA